MLLTFSELWEIANSDFLASLLKAELIDLSLLAAFFVSTLSAKRGITFAIFLVTLLLAAVLASKFKLAFLFLKSLFCVPIFSSAKEFCFSDVAEVEI
jgi:hypothetical protein